MKRLFRIVVMLCIAINFTTTGAQENTATPELSLDSGTLNNQFEYVIQKSSRWRDERGRVYKVVRQQWLTTLKQHTMDSLNAVHKSLTATQGQVDAHAQEIESLKTSLTNTQNTLTATNQEKDSMALFGAQMSKTNYNALMWSIIVVLIVLLLFFVFKFRNSNAITKSANLKLAEVEEEFDEHRRTALEREQKVRRQLQDEINKQKTNNT
ncbi:MAG: tRNA (guanine-N1)-methyltransferase [Bacteroidota bacterium]